MESARTQPSDSRGAMTEFLITVVVLARWNAPVWGQRLLAFLRDLDRFRDERHQRHRDRLD